MKIMKLNGPEGVVGRWRQWAKHTWLCLTYYRLLKGEHCMPLCLLHCASDTACACCTVPLTLPVLVALCACHCLYLLHCALTLPVLVALCVCHCLCGLLHCAPVTVCACYTVPLPLSVPVALRFCHCLCLLHCATAIVCACCTVPRLDMTHSRLCKIVCG